MVMVPTVPDVHRLSLRNKAFLQRIQEQERPGPHRALTAAATPLDLTDKTEARKIRVLRQGWQFDAGAYVKSIPELSFAYRFLANASSRMRYYPALVNPEEPDGPPIPVHEYPNAPQGLADSMAQAMAALGVGRLALAPMQEALSYALGIPGECYMVGTNDGSHDGTWKIRSIEEFLVFDDEYKLREVPLDPQGVLGWVNIDPDTTYAARIWVPDFMFSKLAWSPMRALLDTSEELLLLSRDVRAVARSRLAGGGILKIPEGLRMLSFTEDNEDFESEDWFGRFAEIMMTPLADEGTASAVVPIGVSGAAEDLKDLDHLLLDRPYSALAIELRAEAIGRLATGLDFPREILEGIGDVNHWSGALVSDENFRHHIEPQVIKQVDAMTVAYLRPWLNAAGFEQFWVNRACVWYDPVDLISKPDPMANAVPLFDRNAISFAALREAGGFGDEDAPTILEIYLRQLGHMRTFPPNVLEAIIHAVDPELDIPPIEGSGQVPGIGPQGAIEPVAPDVGALPPAPATAPPTPPATPPTLDSPSEGPPGPAISSPTPTAFATRREDRRRLSRRLTTLDSNLRTRVQTAASAAVLRHLDRAGAKLRTKVADRKYRDADVKAMVQRTENRRLPATLGAPLVAALGFPTAESLLSPDWDDLRRQFTSWVRTAQAEALRLAARIADLSLDDPRVSAAADRLEAQVTPAWAHLEADLNRISAELLYRPDPNSPDEVVVNPDTLVPPGVVRAALTVAGGGTPRTITAARIADESSSNLPTPGVPPRSTPATPASLPIPPPAAEALPAPTNVEEEDDLEEDEDTFTAEELTIGEKDLESHRTGLGPTPEETALGDAVAVGEGAAAVEIAHDLPEGGAAAVSLPSGQIGNGDILTGLFGDADLVPVSFTWEHLGVSPNPFEPHLELDGQDFTSFDDDVLANPGDFPDVEFLLPGDHDGCGCDYTTEWGSPDEAVVGSGRPFAFNPDQPRDEHGKFAPGGSSDSGSGGRPSGTVDPTERPSGAVDAWARAVDGMREPDGGFTVDPTGRPVTSGLSVGGYAPSSVTPADEFFSGDPPAGVDVIDNYLRTNAAAIDADPSLALGGWHDPASGNVFLDVCKVFPEGQRDAAVAAAQANDQIAIADLAAISRGDWDNAIIQTGGTGGLPSG